MAMMKGGSVTCKGKPKENSPRKLAVYIKISATSRNKAKKKYRGQGK